MSTLSVSLVAHGLVLCAALVLIQQNRAPAPLPDTVVALQFVQAPAAVEPSAVPPSLEASPETPAPPSERQAMQTEPQLDQTIPAPAPTPPPDVAEAPAKASSKQPTMAAEPKVERAPAPSPVQLTKPRRAIAHHPLTQSPPATPAAASVPAATALAAILPAHPVAGMETDRPPVYPEAARRRGQQGQVLLQVGVSPQGAPTDVSVAQSSGYVTLDDAAKRAVQQWRFVPAMRGGAPIAAVAEVPVHFRLTD